MIDEITIKDMLALSSQYTYACEDFIIVSEAEKVKRKHIVVAQQESFGRRWTAFNANAQRL